MVHEEDTAWDFESLLQEVGSHCRDPPTLPSFSGRYLWSYPSVTHLSRTLPPGAQVTQEFTAEAEKRAAAAATTEAAATSATAAIDASGGASEVPEKVGGRRRPGAGEL